MGMDFPFFTLTKHNILVLQVQARFTLARSVKANEFHTSAADQITPPYITTLQQSVRRMRRSR
jgi:hypothetical protein